MAKKQESTSKTRPEKNSKTESRKKKTLNNDEALSTESQNDDVSSEEDGLGVNKGSSKHTTEEKIKLGKKKRKTLKEEEEEDEGECKFPMNRISRIVRSDFNSDLRIAQEAVFLINRASEKFLQLFCREAYACAFIDHKNYIAYNHLSSVVSKRKRFDFLSDFVPQKVQAEYALKQISGAEK